MSHLLILVDKLIKESNNRLLIEFINIYVGTSLQLQSSSDENKRGISDSEKLKNYSEERYLVVDPMVNSKSGSK